MVDNFVQSRVHGAPVLDVLQDCRLRSRTIALQPCIVMQGFFHFLWQADPHLEAELRDLMLIRKSIRWTFKLMAEAAIALLSKVSRVVYRLLDGVSKVFDTTRVVMFVRRNVDEQIP